LVSVVNRSICSPSFEIHINSTNRLAATENFEVPAEQELWLNSGEL
jgi:hypothetical protein